MVNGFLPIIDNGKFRSAALPTNFVLILIIANSINHHVININKQRRGGERIAEYFLSDPKCAQNYQSFSFVHISNTRKALLAASIACQLDISKMAGINCTNGSQGNPQRTLGRQSCSYYFCNSINSNSC